MKHSNQRPGRPRRAYAWLLVPVLLLALGSAGAAAPVAAQGSFGTVTIQVQLVDANGAQVSGDLSNYVFTLNSGGATFPMPATNTQGSTQLGVPAGNYTLQMQPRAGVTQQGFFIGTQQVVGFSIAAGQTVTVTARNQVAGTGVIVMTKQIVDQAGTILSVTDRSGFQIQIIGPNNFTQTITTDVNGVVTLGNLAPGTYQLTEQGRAGFTFSSMTINGVSVQNGGSFNLVTGSTSQVIINNRQGGGTGTVQVTKQIVDANNAIVSSGDRSGFQFTLTCGTASAQSTTDTTGVVTFSNVPSGNCQLSEATRTGFTFAGIFVGTSTADIGNNGTFQVTANQTTSLTVRNRGATAQTEQIQLFTGCNNISLTWPNGTAASVVAGQITPAGTLIALWRFENAQQRFLGYSPIPGAPNDLNTVNRFDAVFACVNGPATMTRPVA